MTIEAFRNSGSNGIVYNTYMPPMIPVTPIVDKKQSSTCYWVTKKHTNMMSNNGDDTHSKNYTNNPIKIKAETKKPNTLEMVLGIVPKN
jgi:hypothetical protein